MKRIYISERVRKIVALRAGYECEYCRVSQEDHFLSFEIDHIISLKHGGDNEIENLAWACPYCNQNKGTDTGTILENKEILIPIYHPRNQHWNEHFKTENGEIIPLSNIGKASIKILRFNEPDLLIFRLLLSQTGRYDPL